MPKKNKKIKEVLGTNRLLTSVLVIIFYFAWPIIIKVFENIFNVDSSTDLLFGIICNVVLAVLLISIYHKDLKEYLKKFNKDKFKLYILLSLWAHPNPICNLLLQYNL